jgi:hypothetical protein
MGKSDFNLLIYLDGDYIDLYIGLFREYGGKGIKML